MKSLFFSTLLAASSLAGTSVLAASVNLNTWTAESYPSVGGFSDGVWTVSGGGATVDQTVNGQPTLFYSDFMAQGTKVTGTIAKNGGDNDFVGFVLGFNPGDSGNAAADYLLVDWKQGTQPYDFGQPNDGPSTNALLGLAVSRVSGIPTANEFWGHNNYVPNASGGLTELARANTLGNVGYVTGQAYSFGFDFGPNNLIVTVDGVEQFNIAGSFNNGRMGFYNFSQANVVYSAFEKDVGTFPSAVPLPSSGLLVLGGLGLMAAAKRRKLSA